MTGSPAIPVGAVRAELGEGPAWDAVAGVLWWVDIPAGRVHRTDPASGATTTTELEPPVSAVLTRSRSGVLVTRRAAVAELEGGRVVAELPVPARMRLNDAKCDPAGRLWVGSMSPGGRAEGAFYRVAPGSRPDAVLEGVTISNGLGWSPDGDRLFYIDTPTQRIDVLDFDVRSGAAVGRRAFAAVPSGAGRPDGLAVDAEGGVWVALFGGTALHRYGAGGELDFVVPLPVSHPTSCAFGGAALDELYVTTACRPLDVAARRESPLAGRLLRLRPGVCGAPVAACEL
jgi:sugar lactone lactonase YvrE